LMAGFTGGETHATLGGADNGGAHADAWRATRRLAGTRGFSLGCLWGLCNGGGRGFGDRRRWRRGNGLHRMFCNRRFPARIVQELMINGGGRRRGNLGRR